jgi:uracil-DNA glycosylase
MALIYTSVDKDWQNIFMSIPKDIRDKLDHDILCETEKFKDVLEILPALEDRLNAFKYFKPIETKVVIFGQDPYQNKPLPMGLSFSVPPGVKVPPSLANIYKELENCGYRSGGGMSGDLRIWAERGVLLLNTSLTVVERLSNSHQKYWLDFTKHFVSIFSEQYPDTVYILFGNDAKKLKKYIKSGYFVETAHPSPLAANKGGFFGTKPFLKANTLLENIGKTPVDWNLV